MSGAVEYGDARTLEFRDMVGFEGKVKGGLKIHPGGQHMIYSIGNTVIVEDLTTKTIECLSGHTNNVSCIAVSKSGRYIASGQVTHMGFKAKIILWEFDQRSLVAEFELHMVKVEDLAFSPNEIYLASLGGQDDGSVVIWDLNKLQALCGSPAQVKSAGTTHCIAFSNKDDDLFFTGGNGTLRSWSLDFENRKIRPTDVDLGKAKRKIICIVVEKEDGYFYCGTSTGDILVINISTNKFMYKGPDNSFSQGVLSLALLKSDQLVVGCGDGTVAICKKDDEKKVFKKTKSSAKIIGAVTSIALRGSGHQFFCGTDKSHMYRFNQAEFTHELLRTSHNSCVNDIAFPVGISELFATCSYETIRVWNFTTSTELLRITVPNMTCNALVFMPDGRSIVSAWNDGKIRTFYPESGNVMYTIGDAHNQGVTAIATTSNNRHIVSGGGEGQVRLWSVDECRTAKGPTMVPKLVAAMKEHKAKVTCVKVRRHNDSECISASEDGSCIIWDLEKSVRRQIIFANTLFQCVCSTGDGETQIITSGTDRQIGYWSTVDGSLIRNLEGSQTGSINGMDTSSDCKYFVTGGDDKFVKVWEYDEGKVTHIGIGHASEITKVKISPDSRFIVSVSKDGAILRWNFPV